MAFSAQAKATSSFSSSGEANKLYLLQENGDFLLQENGDKIIIGFGSNFAGVAEPTSSFTAQAEP